MDDYSVAAQAKINQMTSKINANTTGPDMQPLSYIQTGSGIDGPHP